MPPVVEIEIFSVEDTPSGETRFGSLSSIASGFKFVRKVDRLERKVLSVDETLSREGSPSILNLTYTIQNLGAIEHDNDFNHDGSTLYTDNAIDVIRAWREAPLSLGEFQIGRTIEFASGHSTIILDAELVPDPYRPEETFVRVKIAPHSFGDGVRLGRQSVNIVINCVTGVVRGTNNESNPRNVVKIIRKIRDIMEAQVPIHSLQTPNEHVIFDASQTSGSSNNLSSARVGDLVYLNNSHIIPITSISFTEDSALICLPSVGSFWYQINNGRFQGEGSNSSYGKHIIKIVRPVPLNGAFATTNDGGVNITICNFDSPVTQTLNAALLGDYLHYRDGSVLQITGIVIRDAETAISITTENGQMYGYHPSTGVFLGTNKDYYLSIERVSRGSRPSPNAVPTNLGSTVNPAHPRALRDAMLDTPKVHLITFFTKETKDKFIQIYFDLNLEETEQELSFSCKMKPSEMITIQKNKNLIVDMCIEEE